MDSSIPDSVCHPDAKNSETSPFALLFLAVLLSVVIEL